MKLAITGASGKTGFRVAEEAIAQGHKVKLIIRDKSQLPESLLKSEQCIISLSNAKALDEALKGCDGLVIATGARPSIDLTGPLKVDAIGVSNQIESCKRVGLKRVILVSSLCTGKFFHPLNLFGLILLWKNVGENALIKSELDWTIVRPGGLSEKEDNLNLENILYTKSGTQEEGSIPRRLVARCCIECLKIKDSIGKIIEITSSSEIEKSTLKNFLNQLSYS